MNAKGPDPGSAPGKARSTGIKLCGMQYPEDIRAANALHPEYIGFVFAPGSRRYITARQAEQLKALLSSDITAVGVFVNAPPAHVAQLLHSGVIDMAQLHGTEDEVYLRRLRRLTDRPCIHAFRVQGPADLAAAAACSAAHILLDSGAGSGRTFRWELLSGFPRPFFLAGGLHPGNVGEAVRRLHPFAVDVSSGIETDGRKDPEKMRLFVQRVRSG